MAGAVLFFFMLSQCICFFLLSALLLNDRFRGRVAVVLVNTMLPSAACLAAKFFAKECIVYVHETSVSPAAFKKFLRYFVNNCASNVIYVSHYLQEVESFEKPSQIVIYNGLRADLSFPSDFNLQDKFHNRYVLFCGSLKDYKGIGQLVELAKKMCDYQFMAALNCEPEEIEQLANSLDNLTFLSRPDNLGRLYEDAFLVVNLSLPDQWVETFGLSLLEGMAAGCPVIGPPVGGPMELVTEEVGKNIDSRDVDQLEEYIRYLGENYILWEIKSRAAAERAELFGAAVYQQNISVFFSVLFSK